jgi:hypothetical protein
MSGLNPLAAQSVAAAGAQSGVEEALNLGVAIEILQSEIAIGDILEAQVLPPQNGSDFVSLAGHTVAAALPPGINPGETILLQVTGFTNSALIVRNLGVADPENPVPVVVPDLPPPAPDAPQTAVLVTRSEVPPSPPASPASPAAASPSSLAPPSSVFAAAAVRQASPASSQTAPSDESPAAGLRASETHDVEARIAVTRASGLPPPISARAAQPPSMNPASVAQLNRSMVPPQISRSAATPPPAELSAAETGQPESSAPVPNGPPPPQIVQAPPSAEQSLLARLRVPISALTLGAARGVAAAAQSVSSTYARLDEALAKLAPDPRVATLRPLLDFVGKLDIRNVRALPEQINAFVNHVVAGPESKLAQIVRAWSQAAAAEVQSEDAQTAEQAAAPQTTAPAPAPPQSAPAAAATAAPIAVVTNAQAQAAERAVALDYDVKTAILALIANPPQNAPPQVLAALRDALGATTSLQLNVLAAQNNDPTAITIPLPAYFREGGAPAQLRISKDAPGGGKALDGGNFRIAFILDTASLGTVAIDLQAVGREVKVDVKTERATAAQRFSSTLGDLRGRLELLHYKVASIAAGIAPSPGKAEPEAAAAPPNSGSSNVDMRA